jgi:hypothetical protein
MPSERQVQTMKPMRMFVLLAVFWAAGSLLLAAESPSTSTPKPAPAAEKTPAAGAAAEDAKADGKATGKGSIADQAEEALKVAAEGDKAAAAAAAAKGAEAQDDTAAPPSGGANKGPSPQRFVPSEQVRADFDVSFPIDI